MESSPHYQTGKDTPLSPETLLTFAQGWVPPSTDEVRALLKLANLTGGEAAKIIGVTGRTIRRYVGGEKQIHYAEWRLLLLYAKLVEPEVVSI